MKKSTVIVIVILFLVVVIGIPLFLKVMYDRRVNNAQRNLYQESLSTDS